MADGVVVHICKALLLFRATAYMQGIVIVYGYGVHVRHCMDGYPGRKEGRHKVQDRDLMRNAVEWGLGVVVVASNTARCSATQVCVATTIATTGSTRSVQMALAKRRRIIAHD